MTLIDPSVSRTASRTSSSRAIPAPRAAARTSSTSTPSSLSALVSSRPSRTRRRGSPSTALRRRSRSARGELEQVVGDEQGHDRDQAAPQRRVLADHRILDGVRDEQDDDQLEDRHLADLALARHPQDEDQEQVDDRGPEDDLRQARAEVGERHDRVAGVRLGQDLLELAHVVLEVADDEPVRHRLDRELAAGRVEAASRQLRRSQGAPAPVEAPEGSRRSGRTALAAAATGRARRWRCAPGRWRSGRTAPARVAGQDPLDLAQPVRSHLGKVGEHLARSPAGFIRVVEGLGQRPRRPGLHGGSCRGKAALGSVQTVQQVVHARQCGTRGVAWMAKTTGRPRRSAADRPADSRGDPR